MFRIFIGNHLMELIKWILYINLMCLSKTDQLIDRSHVQNHMLVSRSRLKFHYTYEDGFIAFEKPRDFYSSIQMYWEIVPDIADGVILYTGDNSNIDFISLALIDYHIEFRFNFGSGMGLIRSLGRVDIHKLNTLTISRTGKQASLKLNYESPIYNSSQGDYSVLGVDQPLYVGGYPNIQEIFSNIGTYSSFKGCFKKFVANGKEYISDKSSSMELEKDDCLSRVCSNVKCQNGGHCISIDTENYICKCFLGTYGKHCEHSGQIQIPGFTNFSYLQYEGLHRRSLSHTSIEIVVKPLSCDGLILYNGYSPTGHGDFISVTISNCHVELAFNLGTGAVTIRSNEPLSLDQWHKVKVSRTGRQGHLIVDTQKPVSGISPGAFTQLTLTSNLYIGGLKTTSEVSHHLTTTSSFTGCLQKVVVNGRILDLIGQALDGVNIDNCRHQCANIPCVNNGVCVPHYVSYSCMCPVGYVGSHCEKESIGNSYKPRFSQNSFLRFSKPKFLEWVSGARTEVEMKVKLNQSSGLLLWIGENSAEVTNDFLSLGLTDGSLELRYNLGSGEALIRNKFPLSTNWQFVRINRFKQFGTMEIGGKVVGRTKSSGKYFMLDLKSPIYIGGMPDVAWNTRNRYDQGFSGCITNVTFSRKNVNLLQSADGGQNIDYCF